MKNLVVLSGAGISAESGIKTFRDANGLWEGHDIMEVASPQGWSRNKEVVLEFYNQRRKQALQVKPNNAHYALVELEKFYNVTIITQNVDDLHERAGSTQVLHLHGELMKARSTVDPSLIYELDNWQLCVGNRCEKGSQLRPHIVWFGEDVPLIGEAARLVKEADVFIVVGTSLQVYPAAGLIEYVREGIPIYVIDINIPPLPQYLNVTCIENTASEGLITVLKNLV